MKQEMWLRTLRHPVTSLAENMFPNIPRVGMYVAVTALQTLQFTVT